MIRLRRHLVAGALGLVCAAVAIAATTARAASVPESGWWYAARLSGVPALVPTPPGVPEDGLYVAGGPAGAAAVAAVRAAAGPGTVGGTLRLDVVERSGDVLIGACATESAWKPARGGAWDERPMPDCDKAAIAGVLSADGTSVTFDLAAFVVAGRSRGVVDLVIVPGSANGMNASFTVSFAPPAADALVLRGSGAGSEPSAGPVRQDDGQDGSAPDPAEDRFPLGPAGGGAAPPFEPADGAERTPEPTTALEVPEVAEQALPIRARPPVAPSAGGGGPATVASALVAALVFVLAIVLRDQAGPIAARVLNRAPADAEDRVLGFGRFARARGGEPPPLS